MINTNNASKPWRKDSAGKSAIGCICPIQNGCRVKQSMDPDNLPTDAVRVTCTNGYEKCRQVPWVHAACFQEWTQQLLRNYKALGNRARNDAKMERYFAVNEDHLWGTHAYGKLIRFCRCPCGGSLKKYLQVQQVAPPSAASKLAVAAGGGGAKPKKQLPKLVNNPKPNQRVKGPSLTSWQADRARCVSEGADFFGEKCLSNTAPNLPPGLYVVDEPSKAIRPSLLLRKVDNCVMPNFSTKPPPSGKPRRLTAANAPANVMLPAINNEEELMDELNALIEEVPDDTSREHLTDLVNNVLGRAVVDVCSVVADAGGIWEYLKLKSTEVVEAEERERESRRQKSGNIQNGHGRDDYRRDVTTFDDEDEWMMQDELDSGYGNGDNPRSATPSVGEESPRIVKKHNAVVTVGGRENVVLKQIPCEYVQFCGARSSLAAFCYRESLANIEILAKQFEV